jgi:hypothetical protein
MKLVSIIGIEVEELRWIKMLLTLLRHPQPGMAELARQALQYLDRSAAQRTCAPLPIREEQHGPF